MSKFDKYLSIPMSDSDIRRQIKGIKIIKYGDLDNYNSIDDALGPNNMLVILVETMINSGHWMCVLKYNNVVEVFDSYGLPIDAGLKYVSAPERKELDEVIPQLSNLLNKCNYQVVYNKTDLQDWDPNIKTCGRHVCLRLKNRNKNLKEDIQWIENERKRLNLSYDQIACYYIH